MRIRVVVLAVMVWVVIVGCAGTQRVPPEPTLTASPTMSQFQIIFGTGHAVIATRDARSTMEALTPSATPTITQTPRPTLTPTVGPSPTAGPIPDPNDDAVWYSNDDLIVYVHNERLCAKKRDSDPVYLAPGVGIPEWAPRMALSSDGQRIAFLKRYDYELDEIWVARIDGSELKRATSLGDLHTLDGLAPPNDFRTVVDLEWIPGTSQIVFTTGRIDYGTVPYNDLNIVDVDTGKVRTLIKPGSGGANIMISPDGKIIAMRRWGNNVQDPTPPKPDWISFINIDGTGWRQSVFSFVDHFQYDTELRYSIPIRITWANDSSGLNIALPGQNPLLDPSTKIEGWHVPKSGDPILKLTLEHIEYETLWGSPPEFSPDGKFLTFQGAYDGEFGLHLIETNTLDRTLYHEGSIIFLGWEPDSRHFLFEVYERNAADKRYRGGIGEDYEPYVKLEPPREDCVP